MRRVRLLRLALVAIIVGVVATVGVFVVLVPRSGPSVAIKPAIAKPTLAPTSPPAASGELEPEAEGADDAPPDGEVGLEVLGQGSEVSFTRYDGLERRVQFTADEFVELDDETLARGHVRISTTDSDGQAYVLTADLARTGKAQSKFRAEGSVAIRRDDGLEVNADWAEHYEREKLDVVGGNVRASHEHRRLACERLDYEHDKDLYRLSDGVSVLREGPDSALVASDFLRIERKEDRAQLRGGVRIARGPLGIAADRMEIQLEGGDLRLVELRARRGNEVTVEWWGDAGDPCAEAKLTTMQARGIDVEFDDDGKPARLRPYPAQSGVHLRALGPPDQVSQMYVRQMVAELTPDGKLREVHGRAVVWKREPDAEEGEASLSAQQAIARFDGGELRQVDFPAGVQMERDGTLLEGGRGVWSDGTMVVESEPSLESDRSRLTAQRIEVRSEVGELVATGEVETVETAAAGELPLRVRAGHMETVNGGERVIYRDDARAWRGRHILEAAEIRADKPFAGLEAEGGVTIELTSDDGPPVKARADRAEIDGDRAILAGSVEVWSDDIELSATRVEVDLVDGGASVSKLTAFGMPVVAVRAGRTTESERLVHHVDEGRTELFGEVELARIVDAEGNSTAGDVLTLWRDGDTLHVGSRSDGVAHSRFSPGPEAGAVLRERR